MQLPSQGIASHIRAHRNTVYGTLYPPCSRSCRPMAVHNSSQSYHTRQCTSYHCLRHITPSSKSYPPGHVPSYQPSHRALYHSISYRCLQHIASPPAVNCIVQSQCIISLFTIHLIVRCSKSYHAASALHQPSRGSVSHIRSHRIVVLQHILSPPTLLHDSLCFKDQSCAYEHVHDWYSMHHMKPPHPTS